MNPSKHDWDALQKMAEQAGLPPERVGLLRRRWDNTMPRPGSPYLLLVGRPDAGIELLLARWIAPEAAEALCKSSGHSLLIGPSPHQVKPRLAPWPIFVWKKAPAGHLLALRVGGLLPADTTAQVASLGYVEEVVLITRLGQPLTPAEQALAGACRTLAATVRVLVVGLIGEEPTDADLVEVPALAMKHMRHAGFGDGRCLGAGIWFAGASASRPGIVCNLEQFLPPSEQEVAAGRQGMLRQSFIDLLADIRRAYTETSTPPAPSVAAEERDRLCRELSVYLVALGRELQRLPESGRPCTTQTLRTYVLNAVRGWGAYVSMEGFWLKHVEHLRPGLQTALFQEVESALDALSYQPPLDSPRNSHNGRVHFVVERVFIEAKRSAIGLVVGLLAYGATVSWLSKLPAGDGISALPAVAVTLLSYASLLLGMALGYGLGRFLVRGPALSLTPDKPSISTQNAAGGVIGWAQVESRILAWFAEQINSQPLALAEECDRLAERLGIKEQSS